MSLIDKSFTYIKYNRLTIFISETPDDSTIESFINQLYNHSIKHVVRLCGHTYDQYPILNSNINFYDWDYPDGSVPTKELIIKWNQLIKLNEPILVHCLAGLGRSPLLVAISLIENKMNQYDAIEYIRCKRPGSINSIQLKWLRKYKPTKISFFKRIFG